MTNKHLSKQVTLNDYLNKAQNFYNPHILSWEFKENLKTKREDRANKSKALYCLI